jgi:hypothetical protein
MFLMFKRNRYQLSASRKSRIRLPSGHYNGNDLFVTLNHSVTVSSYVSRIQLHVIIVDRNRFPPCNHK